jgi:hypothetical protein
MAVLRYTVWYLREGKNLKEARAAAEERALKEGKLHGASKLKCELAEIMQELAEEEEREAAEKQSLEVRRKRDDVEVAEEEPSSSFTQIVAPGSRVNVLRKSKLEQRNKTSS